MPTPGSLTIIAGPPGAGKTTVAALIAETATRPTVHLHTDTFHTWIRTGFVLPYLPEAVRQNEVVNAVTAEAARVLKAEDAIRGLRGAFTDLGELEPCAVDSTGRTVEETAPEVRGRMLR